MQIKNVELIFVGFVWSTLMIQGQDISILIKNILENYGLMNDNKFDLLYNKK